LNAHARRADAKSCVSCFLFFVFLFQPRTCRLC
jgi:hypothetical protein